MKHSNIYLACLGSILFLVLPIILAGRLYNDDYGRSIFGYFGWSDTGRYFADYIYYLFNLGSPAINVFPLNQIIASLFIALACVLLSSLFNLTKPSVVALATLPLGGQPYFLENLSYSFDALSMSCGLLCAVASATLLIKNGSIKTILLSAFLLFASLSLYQQAANVYFIVFVYAMLREFAQKGSKVHIHQKKIINGILVPAFAFAAYVPIYKLTTTVDYALEKVGDWNLTELPNIVYTNLVSYWSFLYYDWKGTVFGICVVIILLQAVFLLPLSKRDNTTGSQGSLKKPVISIIFILLVIFSYGILLFMKDPGFDERYFISVGAILALCCLEIAEKTNWETIKGKISARVIALNTPIFILSYSLIVFSYAYGQASAAQKEYENAFMARLMHDIEALHAGAEFSNVAFIYGSPASPIAVNAFNKFRLIDRLVTRHMEHDYFFGKLQLMTYGLQISSPEEASHARDLIINGTAQPKYESSIYKLYIVDDDLIVAFNEQPKQRK